jgi:hypothetical protein
MAEKIEPNVGTRGFGGQQSIGLFNLRRASAGLGVLIAYRGLLRMRDTTRAIIDMPTTAGMASKPGTAAALVETLVVGGLPVAEGDEDGSCASTCRCRAVT